MSGEDNGGFTPWGVPYRGWYIVNDYGRSTVSPNDGSGPSFCSGGDFVGIAGILENTVRPRNLRRF